MITIDEENYYNKLLAKFKQDPKFELMQEYGKLLMRSSLSDVIRF